MIFESSCALRARVAEAAMPYWPFSPAWVGLVALTVTPCLTATPSSASDVGCPGSVVQLYHHGNGGYTTYTAVAFDTMFTPSGYDSAHVAVDHHQARLSVSAVGALWAGVRVVERIDVEGVALGTPVSAVLVYQLAGEASQWCGGGGCGVYLGGTLAFGADSTSDDAGLIGPCDGCGRTLSATLTLPVTIVAGTPIEPAFTLLYHTSFVGNGVATGVGTFGIAGLPLGTRAIACSEAVVTPVRMSSWGRLKAFYR